MLRSRLYPPTAYVIPSALVADQFKPAVQLPPTDTGMCHRWIDSLLPKVEPILVTIVVISRLAYRKGIDLLVATAPKICAMFPQVRFIIGTH